MNDYKNWRKRQFFIRKKPPQPDYKHEHGLRDHCSSAVGNDDALGLFPVELCFQGEQAYVEWVLQAIKEYYGESLRVVHGPLQARSKLEWEVHGKKPG